MALRNKGHFSFLYFLSIKCIDDDYKILLNCKYNLNRNEVLDIKKVSLNLHPFNGTT